MTCLICGERPAMDDPDAAACGICVLVDLRRIMDERNIAERALAAARRECEALKAAYAELRKLYHPY